MGGSANERYEDEAVIATLGNDGRLKEGNDVQKRPLQLLLKAAYDDNSSTFRERWHDPFVRKAMI